MILISLITDLYKASWNPIEYFLELNVVCKFSCELTRKPLFIRSRTLIIPH